MLGYDEIIEMSIKSIAKLNESGISCIALTKGILPKELATLSPKNEYGITLISLNENFREKIEPGSAPYVDRIDSLRFLHDRGFRTWVSVEPYPTPNIIEQELDDILKEVAFVDKIIFGRTNYNKEVSSYKDITQFYTEQVNKVIDFCNAHNIEYYIKKGTDQYKTKSMTCRYAE
jgi:DNA repair photolyase